MTVRTLLDMAFAPVADEARAAILAHVGAVGHGDGFVAQYLPDTVRLFTCLVLGGEVVQWSWTTATDEATATSLAEFQHARAREALREYHAKVDPLLAGAFAAGKRLQ